MPGAPKGAPGVVLLLGINVNFNQFENLFVGDNTSADQNLKIRAIESDIQSHVNYTNSFPKR